MHGTEAGEDAVCATAPPGEGVVDTTYAPTGAEAGGARAAKATVRLELPGAPGATVATSVWPVIDGGKVMAVTVAGVSDHAPSLPGELRALDAVA